METDAIDPARVEAALAARTHQGDRYVAFGDVTPSQAREQGERLGAVGTWGPLQRVAKVAYAWKLLAAQMERDKLATVRDLPPADLVEHAERLWVIPPPEGMVEGVRG